MTKTKRIAVLNFKTIRMTDMTSEAFEGTKGKVYIGDCSLDEANTLRQRALRVMFSDDRFITGTKAKLFLVTKSDTSGPDYVEVHVKASREDVGYMLALYDLALGNL